MADEQKKPSSPSRLGIGCWSFGGGAYWGQQSQDDVNAVTKSALDRDITFFDTARMYNDGASERSLGIALGGNRSRAMICSKVSPAKAYYHTLIEECDTTLLHLGTDYIDIYMIHWPLCPVSLKHFTGEGWILENPPSDEEAFAALAHLKKAGKLREIGVSNFGPEQLRNALALCPDIAYNELTYNIFSRAIEAELVPLCAEKAVRIISSMTLQQGLLAGRYRMAEEVPPNQAHSRHFADLRGKGMSRHGEAGVEAEIFRVVGELRQIASELEITVAQLSIAWVLSKPFIASALIGCRNVKQLDDNAKALELALPAAVVAIIDAISRPVCEQLGNSPDYYENTSASRIF